MAWQLLNKLRFQIKYRILFYLPEKLKKPLYPFGLMYINTDMELMAIHIIAETKRESITNLAANSGEEGPDIALSAPGAPKMWGSARTITPENLNKFTLPNAISEKPTILKNAVVNHHNYRSIKSARVAPGNSAGKPRPGKNEKLKKPAPPHNKPFNNETLRP